MHPHTHAVRAPHHHSDQKKRDLTEHAKITTAGRNGRGKDRRSAIRMEAEGSHRREREGKC